MPTGACGIDCDVCRLSLLGICSTCGSGKSQEGFKKLAAQHRILGAPCPILECAIERRVEFCPSGCDQFPCDVFKTGPYPFSQGFLDMQERRRQEGPTDKAPSGQLAKVPVEYWEELRQRDPVTLCDNSLAKPCPPNGFLLRFLAEDFLVDVEHFCLRHQLDGRWVSFQKPLLELACLVYLLNVGPECLSQEMVGVEGLKDAQFFHGPHKLMVQPLLDRYADDLDGFKGIAEGLGGESLELADAACRVWAFPKIPIYYLFWKGDEEFEPRLSILFDRSIECHLPADAIWGIVNQVSHTFLVGSWKEGG